ncbi:MAG: hypothetical protein ACYCTV_05005 [Leptospirales bacterium]
MSIQTKTTQIAKKYPEQVVAGEISACEWVQLACQRQLNDLAKFRGKSSPQFHPKLVDALGRVLLTDRGDVLAELRGHHFRLVGVVPDLVEQAQGGGREAVRPPC